MQNYRRIGHGFCGSVWAASDGSKAMKREDGGPGRSVYKDFIRHQKALNGAITCHSDISLPECHQFVPNSDSWWEEHISKFPEDSQPRCNELVHSSDSWWPEHISKFPEDSQQRCNVLVTERIRPFGEPVRHIIFEMYGPKVQNASIEMTEADRDCLIRPYLGRRRLHSKPPKFFSLRNYPLHMDQIEQLGLDSECYARVMAETLAMLYWSAHIDANDVEFVLAPPRRGLSTNQSTIDSDILGPHTLWMLDFDCCRDMSHDESGVEQAVRAFLRNDPFYPRPGRDNDNDQKHWTLFKACFLKASAEILGYEGPEACLPVLWVSLVEQRGRPAPR